MSTFSKWSAADVAAFNARNTKKPEATASEALEVVKERVLHNEIIAECRHRGWIYFHGSMAHRAMRTLGEPDFTILADGGRIFFIECKTKTGKLSREQLGLKLWAENLGHAIHACRSIGEFLKVIQ